MADGAGPPGREWTPTPGGVYDVSVVLTLLELMARTADSDGEGREQLREQARRYVAAYVIAGRLGVRHEVREAMQIALDGFFETYRPNGKRPRIDLPFHEE